jgi:DNA-binding NarL/FixJ family response regulator
MGEPIKAIGMRLNVSPKTVEFHVAALKRKLRIQDLATLTHFALAHGYVKLMFSTALTRGDKLELL